MLLSVFTIVLALLSIAVAVLTHLCVIRHHFCCPITLFQGHVAFWNFTLAVPQSLC